MYWLSPGILRNISGVDLNTRNSSSLVCMISVIIHFVSVSKSAQKDFWYNGPLSMPKRTICSSEVKGSEHYFMV